MSAVDLFLLENTVNPKGQHLILNFGPISKRLAELMALIRVSLRGRRVTALHWESGGPKVLEPAAAMSERRVETTGCPRRADWWRSLEPPSCALIPA